MPGVLLCGPFSIGFANQGFSRAITHQLFKPRRSSTQSDYQAGKQFDGKGEIKPALTI